jgi:hypothetical protein
MERYVVKSVEERLLEWRALEREASELEAAIAQVGQAAATPEFRDRCLKARELRERSDREFAAIVRSVRLGDEGGAASNEEQFRTEDAQLGKS